MEQKPRQLPRQLEVLVSTTNPELAALQRKAVEMGQYYYYSFDRDISTILQLVPKLSNPLTHKQAEDILKKIIDFYSTIPFQNLQGREEFYPLFIVNKLLKIFNQTMEDIFQEKNKEKSGIAKREIGDYGLTLMYVHRLYSDALKDLLHSIRPYTEGRDFVVPIQDPIKRYI